MSWETTKEAPSSRQSSGLTPQSTRTKMAVDLSVVRRQLEEALGNSCQTYDLSFFSFCSIGWIEISSVFFLFVLKVLEQHENVVQTKGKCVCLTVTLDCNNTPLKTALSTSDKIV